MIAKHNVHANGETTMDMIIYLVVYDTSLISWHIQWAVISGSLDDEKYILIFVYISCINFVILKVFHYFWHYI